MACPRRRNLASLALVVLVFLLPVHATRYFPSTEVWYQDISTRALDPNSDGIINALIARGGWGTGALRIDFSMIVNPMVSVTWASTSAPNGYYDDCDFPMPATFPMPAGGMIEGQPGYQCDTANNDCHLLVVDRANNKLYESYQTNFNTATNKLETMCIVVWDLCRDYPDAPAMRGEWCTSCDAAGYPITPLLVDPDEVFANNVDHAIRFILPNNRIRLNQWFRPASHTAGGTANDLSPPYGVHFRLKASYDISALSTPAKAVAAALKKYGMFLSDGGNLAFTFAGDSSIWTHTWASTGATSTMLNSIPPSAFEVVLSPDGGTLLTHTNQDCIKNVLLPVSCSATTAPPPTTAKPPTTAPPPTPAPTTAKPPTTAPPPTPAPTTAKPPTTAPPTTAPPPTPAPTTAKPPTTAPPPTPAPTTAAPPTPVPTTAKPPTTAPPPTTAAPPTPAPTTAAPPTPAPTTAAPPTPAPTTAAPPTPAPTAPPPVSTTAPPSPGTTAPPSPSTTAPSPTPSPPTPAPTTASPPSTTAPPTPGTTAPPSSPGTTAPPTPGTTAPPSTSSATAPPSGTTAPPSSNSPTPPPSSTDTTAPAPSTSSTNLPLTPSPSAPTPAPTPAQICQLDLVGAGCMDQSSTVFAVAQDLGLQPSQVSVVSCVACDASSVQCGELSLLVAGGDCTLASTALADVAAINQTVGGTIGTATVSSRSPTIHKKKPFRWYIIVGVVGGLLVLAAIGAAIYWFVTRNKASAPVSRAAWGSPGSFDELYTSDPGRF